VISGTTRRSPGGIISMPPFGSIYSDTEIAAVANYVTKRFDAEGSTISAKEVADLRGQTSH
jgi:mono/diheme cytochrome c family protein